MLETRNSTAIAASKLPHSATVSRWSKRRFWAVVALLSASRYAVMLAQGLNFSSMEARPAPAWLPTASVYEIWLNVFSKSGDLRGATLRLPEIAKLGATIVYLGPIAKRSADPKASPYSIADYNEIDPECGTAQDLRDFVAAAHKLHLKVMLDVVYYHTAPDHRWMQQNPSFLVHSPEGEIVRGFWPQPLPDFRNATVRKLLADSLVHWVRDFDVDGFRCDVGGGVPIAFWNEARKVLDQLRPDILLLSESERPDDQLAAFDINYDFQWYLTLRSVLLDGAPALRLRERWEQTRATMPRNARVLHYSDNPDWPRAVLQFGERGALAASVLNFTLDGIPFLYNGQEINDPGPTSWRTVAPIRWPASTSDEEHEVPLSVTTIYQHLFHLRTSEPAISSGSLTWINNSEPNSVLSFLRQAQHQEVLVVVNLSNRDLNVTLDLPVMDYYIVDNLIGTGKTSFQLYSGRVSAHLPAFGYIVGKHLPPEPLKARTH